MWSALTDAHLGARRVARRVIPYEVRWRARAVIRRLRDGLKRERFACARSDAASFPHLVCSYERPLICYSGQEAQFAAKRRNVALALSACDRVLIAPGETFSFQACVGRPTRRAGYERAAVLRNRALTEDVGGAICLASTLLYNAGLLSGMTIIERRCHSVDTYGTARYFELGRDAAVDHPYIDLRIRNDLAVALLLRTRTEESRVVAEMRTAEVLDIAVEVIVGTPIDVPAALQSGEVPGLRVHTRRIVRLDGRAHEDDLGWSVHHAFAAARFSAP